MFRSNRDRTMKRYAIHVSSDVFVDAENVVQAMELARKAVRLIGARVGGYSKVKNRRMFHYRIEHGELRFGRPIRLQDPTTEKQP